MPRPLESVDPHESPQHLLGSVMRHWRHEVRGLGLQECARQAYVDRTRLSRWERGVDRPGAEAVTGIDNALGAGGRIVALHALVVEIEQLRTGKVEVSPEDEDTDDEMERRTLLQALAALGVTSPAIFEALHDIRDGVGRVIGRDEGSDLEEWEEAVAEYGYRYVTVPPRQLVTDLTADLVIVQRIMARIDRDDRLFQPWCRVTGGLSMLLAKTLSNLGQPREARVWWQTAQQAADTSGDTDLSLWVGGERLLHGLYEHRPVPLLLAKADELIQTRSAPSGRGLASLRAARAQLLALDGPPDAASDERRRHEQVVENLPAEVSRNRGSIAGYGEGQVCYTEAWVCAHRRDTDRLEQAVSRGKHIGPTGVRWRAQLDLLRAAGYVRSGDVTEGVRSAGEVYEALPGGHRATMVNALAEEVLTAVPDQNRSEAVVADYRELLTSAGQRREIT